MQLWCRGINNCLGLPVSQQWGQQERFSSSWHQLHSWCVLEIPAPWDFHWPGVAVCLWPELQHSREWMAGHLRPPQQLCCSQPSLLLAQELSYIPGQRWGTWKAGNAGSVASLPPHPPLLLSLLPSLHPTALALNSSLLSLLLHYSAFLLWQCSCPLFFTSQLPMLRVQEQNSKPCNPALWAMSNDRMKGRGGKAALMLSIWKGDVCFFCSQFC